MRTVRDISISRKLIGIIMLTCMAVLLLSCATFVAYESITFRAHMVQRFATFARIMAEASTAALAFEDRKSANETLAALRAEPHVAAACIYTRDGRPFAAFLRGKSWRDLPSHPGSEGATFQDRHLILFQRIMFDGEWIGTLYMKRDLEDMRQRLEGYAGIVLGILLASSLVALLLSSVLQRLISKPILQLAELASLASKKKDYSRRATKHGNDEIGILVDSFNEMLGQVQSRTLERNQAESELERQVGELCTEIAERRRVQEQVLAAKQAAEESNRAKSAFLANMSHELRTPLNAIIGYSEMLSEEAEGSGRENSIRDLGRITSAGRHLLTLINQVLDLSKVEAGKAELLWEDAPVSRVLQDAMDAMAPLARKNHNQLIADCPPDLPPMHVDVVKFRQSLYNLLSNACKFTECGIVAVDVAPVSIGAADWIEWRIRDTGIGIAPEQMSKLFQPFSQGDTSTTRKYGGTGLGLSISQRFCELMGGGITASSEPGKGSTFTIRLPYRLAGRTGQVVLKSAPAAEAGTRAVRPLHPNCVLVIDDDAMVRDLMVRSLSREGFDVVVASSGEEGLRKASEVQPAAITLDVFMPGMDGWEVLRALKTDAELADIPVILLTVADDRRRACLLGAAEFLQKPVEPERLVAVLKRRGAQTLAGPVLVVDDDPASRDLTARVLRKHSCDVIEAQDGRAALDCMARQKPVLIVLDLLMPGMDGFDFIAALREVEDWRQIPVVALTAKDLNAEDRELLRGSVRRILQKGDVGTVALASEIADLLKGCHSGLAAPTDSEEKH